MHIDQASRLREIVREMQHDQLPPMSVAPTKRATIYAVASGKGGVGKTNISVNLAITLARQGLKVVVVDLDLGLANVDVLLNMSSPYNLEHLMLRQRSLDEIMIKGPAGIRIIPSGSGLPSLTQLADEQRTFFLDAIYTLVEANDVIIFDVAAGISENVIRFTLAADEVIVVTTEEPTAITDAYALIKVLSTHNKILPINMIFNMTKSRYRSLRNFEKIKSVVKQFLGIEVSHLGIITDDSCVSAAIMKRQPFVVQYPLSHAARDLNAIAKIILKKNDVHKGKRRDTFREKIKSLFSHHIMK